MSSTALLNILRFVLLLFVQIIIFNNIDFLRFINPYPYLLFILLFPVNGNKYALLLSAFLLGIIMDTFLNSGGIHTVACTLLAYIRPSLFRFSFGLSYEYQTVRINDNLSPERFSFIAISVLIHHLCMFVLEIFTSEYLLGIILRTIVSSIFTLILCILIIYLIKPSRR
ncbi:rod shape-determining protein MreD [Flavobacterium croceum DSM 17960]|uniref:Rod shape-determining protein MreD n=1 Tax=Flavobacterium croceum DSM 17960 TaxID=1121886 RepID=A0A2S4NA91_9FLAO|nr:rod shape-determining protein MreD [Flavobacterium croceum]POS02616.1 rod shape-determining protein MreD [Flavobacterium croceum DSM 17960]